MVLNPASGLELTSVIARNEAIRRKERWIASFLAMTGYRLLPSANRLQWFGEVPIGYQKSPADCSEPPIGYQRSPAGCSEPLIGYQKSPAGCSEPPTICQRAPATLRPTFDMVLKGFLSKETGEC
ncbi:MAG: hypothetical protein LBD53_08480 [Tannerella sp.]|nr:hypothetical protein [Tannerella sp.]